MQLITKVIVQIKNVVVAILSLCDFCVIYVCFSNHPGVSIFRQLEAYLRTPGLISARCSAAW